MKANRVDYRQTRKLKAMGVLAEWGDVRRLLAISTRHQTKAFASIEHRGSMKHIAKDRHLSRLFLAMVIAGKAFSEIASTDGVSKHRVQDVVNLAMLAPDVLGGIAAGEQPDDLTKGYLIKTRFSAVWSEQRQQFAAL